jgi:hypothetical protein
MFAAIPEAVELRISLPAVCRSTFISILSGFGEVLLVEMDELKAFGGNTEVASNMAP